MLVLPVPNAHDLSGNPIVKGYSAPLSRAPRVRLEREPLEAPRRTRIPEQGRSTGDNLPLGQGRTNVPVVTEIRQTLWDQRIPDPSQSWNDPCLCGRC